MCIDVVVVGDKYKNGKSINNSIYAYPHLILERVLSIFRIGYWFSRYISTYQHL